MITSYQNIIFKDVKRHSLHFILLVDTNDQRTTVKKSNFDKIKDCVKCNWTGLGQESYKPTGSFQAYIEIDDSKFKTSIFVINDNSIDFDMLICTHTSRQFNYYW